MPANIRLMAVLSLALATCALLKPLFLNFLILLFPDAAKTILEIWKMLMVLGPVLGLGSVILAYIVMAQTTADPALPARSIARSGLILGYIALAHGIIGLIMTFNMVNALKNFH